MSASNMFDVLLLDEIKPFYPKSTSTTSKAIKEETKKPKQSLIPVLQTMYSLVMFIFSGATNNEFYLSKLKISPSMKLKKNTTVQELNAKINKMGLSYDCLVWGSSIDTSELKKMLDNQYTLPEEYHHLRDLMCNDSIKSMKRQNVLILDFRRPHLKGKEYIYLKNHQQLFFGNIRESYLTKKSEVNGFKKVYDAICREINFVELNKVILECHKVALTCADTEWIDFRENQIKQFKDAASVFEMADSKVFERFPSFEDLKKEGEMAKTFKQEILEMFPKMKVKYDRKMLVGELYSDAFPIL